MPLKYLLIGRGGTGLLLDIGGGMAVGGKYIVMRDAPRNAKHRFSFILAAPRARLRQDHVQDRARARVAAGLRRL